MNFKDGLSRRATAEQQKANRIKHPKRFILYRLRGNANVRGIPCTLEVTDIPDIPEFCPVFPWIKLVYAVGAGRCDGSLSVDRINSEHAYVPGNIRFISDRANTLKRDASDRELIALGEDARTRMNGDTRTRG
jgi:hypothetical protein